MPFVADLHLHSHFSRATSRFCEPVTIAQTCARKGIDVVSTGDVLHPDWQNELKEKLADDNLGFFKLKKKFIQSGNFAQSVSKVRFVLGTEISTIFKRTKEVKKVHHLVLFPDWNIVDRLSKKLAKIGNLNSDGRPILGLDGKDLLELVLEAGERTIFIPAHIWTPWFSVLGSRSGFNSIADCYKELTKHIPAVETGLSSDPSMNARCSILDGFNQISCSDAHSPDKIGRESTLISEERSFDGVYRALWYRGKRPKLTTMEFFPEEGKYHADGHRKCGVRWHPGETRRFKGICPKCRRPVTIGVSHRVYDLQDKPEKKEDVPGFISLIPLKEILSQIIDVGANSKKVQNHYDQLITPDRSEYDILVKCSISDLHKLGGSALALAISRMRRKEVQMSPGFDGQFGTVSLFRQFEKEELIANNQMQITSGAGLR